MEPSGALLAASWRLFGRSWDIFGALLAVLGDKMSSKRPFGWILVCFANVLGRFWEALGSNLQGFGAECWEKLGKARRNWVQLGKVLGEEIHALSVHPLWVICTLDLYP